MESEHNGCHYSRNFSRATYLDANISRKLRVQTCVAFVVHEVYVGTNRWLLQPHSEMIERSTDGRTVVCRMSSATSRRVVGRIVTGVSNDRSAVIFRLSSPSRLHGTH